MATTVMGHGGNVRICRYRVPLRILLACGFLCACVNSKSKVQLEDGSGSAGASDLKDSSGAFDDVTSAIVTAETLHPGECPVTRRSDRATPDISIRVGRECIVANNFGEFGMRLSFHAAGDDVERTIVSSKVDNIIAFAQLGKRVLAIASVRHLNGRIFELTRGEDGWSSRAVTTLPGDVVRIGEDESTRDIVLLVNNLNDRGPASLAGQVVFRCNRLGQISSISQPIETSAATWLWPTR